MERKIRRAYLRVRKVRRALKEKRVAQNYVYFGKVNYVHPDGVRSVSLWLNNKEPVIYADMVKNHMGMEQGTYFLHIVMVKNGKSTFRTVRRKLRELEPEEIEKIRREVDESLKDIDWDNI